MSTERMSTTVGSRRWSHVGPLASYLDGISAALLARGYTRASVEFRLIKRLSCWLKDEGLGVNALDRGAIRVFFCSPGGRCAAGC